jgi:GT2 family glycosyltransferase
MKLSVVIATFNRCEILNMTLARLTEQDMPSSDFEVIVVDDGSTDNTRAKVADQVGRTPYGLRYYHHSNRGPGASENRGIREARADLVLLIADDIQATPSLLTSHFRFHEKYPQPNIAVLGTVLQSPELPDTVFHRYWDPFRFKELKGARELPYWKFWACNLSVKRSFLLENGLFMETKGAAHEDVELGYRLSRKGLQLLFNEDAVAYHYHVEDLDEAITREYERGFNWIAVSESIPDPLLHVVYDDLTWRTLKAHYSAFQRTEISIHLPGRFGIARYVALQAVRWTMFNRLTIPVWRRLLLTAETSRAAQRLVFSYLYRGTVSYFFLKGAADAACARRMSRTPIRK